MAVASIQVSETPLVLYALRRADDALILGHRLSEWCGHAPMLEEDMALANMGLDLLGQARELYGYAAKVEGKGNDEDKFAYLRDVRQYRNLLLLEQPNGDFARTMVRQFFYAAFADLYWRAMMKSSDRDAGGDRGEIGKGKRLSFAAFVGMDGPARRRHRGKPSPRASRDRRSLGLYRRDVRRRRQRARPDRCAASRSIPRACMPQWLKTVSDVVSEATLALPKSDWMQQGGRSGRHSEHLGHLLSELQSMQRTFPGATW